MTTCSTFANSIKKRVEEGKNLDTIAGELCGDVKFDRQKIIRVIKDFLGEEYLIENAETLGYDIEKAAFGKMPKAPKLRKIKGETDSEECLPEPKKVKPAKNSLENTIRKLLDDYSSEEVHKMVDRIGMESD